MKKANDIPLNNPTPFSSVREMMEIAVRSAGDSEAFKYKSGGSIRTVTYNEFQCDTLYLGTALSNSGLSCRYVAILSENSYKWICVYITMLKSSGVFVPVDRELPETDIINVLESSDSEVLFFSKQYAKNVPSLKKALPGIKKYICLDGDEESSDYTLYDSLIAEGEKQYKNGNLSYVNERSDPNSLKMLVYTSGTTGMAKGVMLSEHNMISVVYYGMMILNGRKSCLSVLPYHHIYEAVTCILANLHNHSTICINDSIRNVSSNLRLFTPEYIFLVPAFLEAFKKRILSTVNASGNGAKFYKLIEISNRLLKVGIDLRRKFFSEIHKSFGGKLAAVICGGAPLRPETAEFFNSIGITVINGYGITECSPLISGNREKINDPETVGVPLPCLDIKIESPDDDGIGEICVKGDVVMLGYYKNEKLTRSVIDSDNYFHTGDLGKFNERGLLMITGRKKNLIVLPKGKNVFPEEIEGYIQSIEYIDEVVVYGSSTDNYETQICAEVYISDDSLDIIGKPNADTIFAMLKKDIADACKKLPSYKLPSKIIVRSSPFDKTTTNKIKRSYS